MNALGEPGESRPGERQAAVCPICGPGTAVVLPFRYRFHERFLFGVRCARCALVFLHPMPDDREIAGMYDEGYYTECSSTRGAHGPAAYMELITAGGVERKRSAEALDRRLVALLGTRGSLLEVGCGPGYFLREMRDLGWTVEGLDVSAFAAEHARAVLGLDVKVGTLETAALPTRAYDAAFLGDVLEHLPRPRESLLALRAAIKPKGAVAVAVPSTLNLLSGRLGILAYRALSRPKTLRIPPYHLVEYTPRTLRRMLAAAGFEEIRIRQSAVPLRRMGLRGNLLENSGKAGLQVMALATSALFNRGGDRLLALARNPRD